MEDPKRAQEILADAVAQVQNEPVKKPTNKVKCWKLTYDQGCGWFVVEEQDLSCFLDEMNQADVGDTFHIEVIEMTREELENMPEFEGF